MRFEFSFRFLFSCTAFVAVLAGGDPARDIPDDPWVEIFFESIDCLTTAAEIPPLRTSSPNPDNLEARFWFGFGGEGLIGCIIRRESGKWSGIKLVQNPKTKTTDSTPVSPRSGWENAWQSLVEKQLLVLPDFGSLFPSDYQVFGGSGVVVEVFAEDRYRTYEYSNSWSFDNEECRAFEALVAAFRFEFLNGDGVTRVRSFLNLTEIRKIDRTIDTLNYPLGTGEFLNQLPVRLEDRGLRATGSRGRGDVWWKEWPLTSRVDAIGYYVLLGYLERTNRYDYKETIQYAEVAYRDRAMGRTLILQPSGFPEKRTDSLGGGNYSSR